MRQVMGNKKKGNSLFLSKLQKKFQNLPFVRQIKRGGGLIRDDELWPCDQAARNGGSLQLSVGKLIRIGIKKFFGKADVMHYFGKKLCAFVFFRKNFSDTKRFF